ncbi:VOC family protein [Andreprevotia chitinilytica]|uniref:VOC family protein n=1 Tax=Andreprevotia chitinilytica TaxID=396808 RepID=UPI0009FE984A|nr:VOC family protein [Andreprevotia chitinilytica]
MPITGFNHYNLRADRPMLDVLCDFYVNIIGLHLGYRPPFSSFGYWLYIGHQDVLHLTEAGPDEKRLINMLNTFDHVAFSCTDLPAFETRLSEFNISYQSGLVPLTGQHQIFCSDPAGNGVELNFAESP